MGRAPRAIHVLNDAEAALRALIAAALKSKQYKDVSVIASLADKLARLRQEVDSSEQTEEEDAPALADSLAPQTIVSRAQAPKSGTAARRLLKPKRVTVPDDYPRFERSDDRLVKVGWSKRDGRSYAHKAPKPGVFLFVRKVRESVGPGKVFSMDKLLPIRDEKGQEVPSYQAYVALAWLRSCGFIERRTKDGYGYAAGALEDAQVERLWASTREQA